MRPSNLLFTGKDVKKMKKTILGILTVLVILGITPAGTASPTTINYGNVTLNNWNSGNFVEIWDLTQGDLTLSYTIDMSGIATAGWAVTEVGIRQVGAPNIDPNQVGGWMQSNYVFNLPNPNTLDNEDMHLLSKHGWLNQYYDATDANTIVTEYWSGNNYGFWFDRDGVDQWQALLWGMSDGDTYNTVGVYEIVITYHAIDANTGTMFATINGVQQGLYIGGWKDAQPEFYPAGRSFTGNMAQMQIFYGRGGGGGAVSLSDITVTGTLYWTSVQIDIKPGSDPNSINLKSKGVVPVAVLGSDVFDATTVDPSKVAFAGATPVRWTLEDVNGDGYMDMLFHFKTQELTIPSGSTDATLTGDTTDGLHIMGTDSVNIVKE